jgi:hypothetical protein
LGILKSSSLEAKRDELQRLEAFKNLQMFSDYHRTGALPAKAPALNLSL